jgi:hypothetical protein
MSLQRQPYNLITESDLLNPSEVMLEVGQRYFVLSDTSADFLLQALHLYNDELALAYHCHKHQTTIPETLEQLHKLTLLQNKTSTGTTKEPIQGFVFRFEILSANLVQAIAQVLQGLMSVRLCSALILLLVGVIFTATADLRFYWSLGFSTEPVVWWQAFSLYFASLLWHELGHATAAQRFSKQCGSIGFGLYYIFPVFYADVSSSWRMSQLHRIATALAGIYFQLIFVIVTLIVGIVNKNETYFLAATMMVISILWTLNPVFKFDGYWALLDFVGDKDLRKTAAKNLLTQKKTSRKFIGSFVYVALSLIYLVVMWSLCVNFYQKLVLRFNDWQQNGYSLESQEFTWRQIAGNTFELCFHLMLVVGGIALLRRCIGIAVQMWKKNINE